MTTRHATDESAGTTPAGLSSCAPWIAQRVKAAAALAVSGVVTYLLTAIVDGTPFTLHGLEVAAGTALLTAYGVHRAPRNATGDGPRRRRRAGRRA